MATVSGVWRNPVRRPPDGAALARLLAPLLALLLVLDLSPGARAAVAQSCRFTLGFKALHDLAPVVVGECLEDEHHNPENGDALQKTTGGLLVWRKRDNFTAFTDGHRSWVAGPYGVQSRLNTERFAWER